MRSLISSLLVVLVAGSAAANEPSTLHADQYGVRCDGKADDTEALQKWLAQLVPGKAGRLPAGECLFSAPLASGAERLAISGAGPYQTVLTYIGGDTNADLIVIGDGRRQTGGVFLSDFRITSRTKMTGGAALRLRRIVRSMMERVIIDGQPGTGNLWDGVWFNEIDWVVYRGMEATAQNTALLVNGGTGPSFKGGLALRDGKIGRARLAVHVGGAVGGFYADQVNIIASDRNVLIDTTLTAEGNRELFFGPTAILDSARVGPALTMADTLANPEGWTQLSGVWLASGASDGIRVEPGVKTILSLTGGTIFNFKGNGIHNLSDRARVIVNGTVIRNNKGAGINGKATLQNPVIVGNGR